MLAALAFPHWLPALGGALGLLSLWGAMRATRRRRLLRGRRRVGLALDGLPQPGGPSPTRARAWSLIDVELKRRHDLLPPLVQVVTALRDFERTVQTELAAFYNARLEMAPDRFVARLAGRSPQRLIDATAFERAPLQVELAA